MRSLRINTNRPLLCPQFRCDLHFEMQIPSIFLLLAVAASANPFSELELSNAPDIYSLYDQVELHLYTRENLKEPDVLVPKVYESLKAARIDPKRPTKIIVTNHEGLAGMKGHLLRDTYLYLGDFNVIEAIWEASLQDSEKKVGDIGDVLELLIEKLESVKGVQKKDISFIGIGLGAQMAGRAAMLEKDRNDPTVGSIVGLDPIARGNHHILTKDDAIYVQIINTTPPYEDSVTGHAEFYPNFGRDMDASYLRSILYFAESLVTGAGFISQKCESREDLKNCTDQGDNRLMGGEPLDSGAEGVFYTSTFDRSPFAKGELGVPSDGGEIPSPPEPPEENTVLPPGENSTLLYLLN